MKPDKHFAVATCTVMAAAGLIALTWVGTVRAVGAQRAETTVRVTATLVSEEVFRNSKVYVRVACEPGCARNHCEGIDAGVIGTRRALEARIAQDLAKANDRLSQLEAELAQFNGVPVVGLARGRGARQ